MTQLKLKKLKKKPVSDMSTVDKMGSEPPTNMASLLVYCATDSSLMLTVENSNSDNWIPSVKVEASVSWSRTIAKEAQEVLR